MIRALLNVYLLIVLIDVVLSYLPQYANQKWAKTIHALSEYTLMPIRRFIVSKIFPKDLSFDLSPVFLLVIIKMIEVMW